MSESDSDIFPSQASLLLRKSQNPKSQVKWLRNCLQEAGLQLSFAEEQLHVLTREQSLVVRDLEKFLQSSSKNCEEFVAGLKAMCKKENYFKKALMEMYLEQGEDSENRRMGRQLGKESLFGLILKVPYVQVEAIDIILEEITSTAPETLEDPTWLKMLLKPLCYLPYIKDPVTLTGQFLDILQIATYPAQIEILNVLPNIIPDEQHNNAAKELCKLLEDDDNLTAQVIDCLDAFNLESEMKAKVHEIILAKMRCKSRLQIFPVLLDFLMNNFKSQNLVQTLLKIRNAVDSIMSSSSNNIEEKETCKFLIFSKLQHYAERFKVVSEAWLNMISAIKVHSDHKPVDYLILFMLHSISAPAKKKIIEAIFKKRVQTGLFKIDQLEVVFEKYLLHEMLKNYFNAILDTGCSLIRSSSDQNIAAYVLSIFELLFSNKHTDVFYQKDILCNLIDLAGAIDKKNVSVLKIISSLNEDKLRKHSFFLMTLLNTLDNFELKDVKEIYEILCRLSCGENADDSTLGLRDELHMIVRKQLQSRNRNVKLRGIVLAVTMVKYMVRTSVHQEGEIPENLTQVGRLPSGPARDAARLLEFTSNFTESSAEFVGLYYDQFASFLLFSEEVDKYFLEWAYQTIGRGFRKTFLATQIHDEINDIKCSVQYSLSLSQNDSVMGINIAEFVLKNSPKILILSSHFRLLRLLHYRLHDGNLTGIDSLLQMGVILPEIDVDDLESDRAKVLADCLFYCANWFREIISGFVTQPVKRIKKQVVQRLDNLLEVEKKLMTCLEFVPGHELPVCYFDNSFEIKRQFNSPVKNEVKPRGNPKKKLKTSTALNELNETANTTLASKSTQSKKKTISKQPSYHCKEHQIDFREIDTDLIILLKYPLADSENTQSSTQTAVLNIDQLKFILKDFVEKLSGLTQNKTKSLSHLTMISPLEIVTDGVKVLPYIKSHLQVIIQQINQLRARVDNVLDSPEMFTEEATDIKTCFGLVLEIFYLIFNWIGFRHSSNTEVLKDLLKSLRKDDQNIPRSAYFLIKQFIETLSGYTEQCLELNHAVCLIKLMETLHSITTPCQDIQKMIVSTANKLLSRRWYNSRGNLEAGRNCNLNIAVLLKAYLSNANIKVLAGLVATLHNQTPNIRTKDDFLPMLPSIDKLSFHVLYNSFCSTFLERVKIEVESLTNSQHLVLWDTTALIMQNLMSIAKHQSSKTNLACFLKKSIGILKIFLTHGIPIMEIMLRSRPDEVVAIFKGIQLSTRFLHHLCCYSKLMKDVTLMASVSKFRLTLESLVFRVKAALVANKCSAAFWMGNLKNRDLNGEDILSQSTNTTEQNEDVEDELPEDDELDEDSDVAILDDAADDNGSVSSVTF